MQSEIVELRKKTEKRLRKGKKYGLPIRRLKKECNRKQINLTFIFMKRQILMLAMLLCTSLAMAQSKFNVKGIIIDKETDEALIAASVQ